VRFIHLAGNTARLLTVGAAAALLAAASAVTPAFALGSALRAAPQFNGGVYAITYHGSTVYVGGSFTRATAGGRAYVRQRLAAYDSRTGTLLDWAPGADATVRALATGDGGIYAAGDFHRISGQRRDAVARLDASSGAVGTFSHTVTGSPYALSVGGGRLYLGGRFSTVDGNRRANLAAFSLSSGGLDGGWRPSADDAVHAVLAYGANVYVGGAFDQVNGASDTARLAAVSAAGGAVIATFLPRAPDAVNGIAADGKGLYAASGGQGGRAVAYTVRGVIRWQRIFDGDAVSIATLNGVAYVGGHFDRACATASNGLHGTCTDSSVPRVKIAAVTSGGALSAWAPQANGVIGVRMLGVDAVRGTIAVGGDFTEIDGQTRRRFATFG
jgi:hypothetical protein